MTCAEFEMKLATLHQTIFDGEPIAKDVTDKNWLNVITAFVCTSPEPRFPFFLLLQEVGDMVEFIINVRDGDVFRANKEELNNIEEDFIPQISVQDRWESYEFDFSTLILTEYVDWLWSLAPDKLEMQIWGYGLYIPIKEHWSQFFNPFSYPNKIWIDKERRSIILIQNESNLLKCLASDTATLNVARSILEN